MKRVYVLVLVLSMLTVGCSLSNVLDNPPWVWKLIVQYQLRPVGNPPQSIWQYEFQGKTVYYIPPQCCDMYGYLYDAEGTYICAPDGGFDGKGDGQCPNFFSERMGERLVWKDLRDR
jgi:hypothetical protein